MLWFVSRHPRTPLAAKLLALVTVAYAFSPIDLIPDFIPVLGYLDEVVLLPIGIYVTMKLIPESVLAECRMQADDYLAQPHSEPRSYAGAVAIVVIWLLALLVAWQWLWPWIAAAPQP
jgi:uncharacterized membrane protein YkvA (DUF1232 family)